jgi:hypothetical protein
MQKLSQCAKPFLKLKFRCEKHAGWLVLFPGRQPDTISIRREPHERKGNSDMITRE